MSDSGTTTLAEEPRVTEREVDATPPPAAGGGFLFEPVIGDVFTRERFSEELREIERMVREFAAERIAPQREELAEHNGELTMELMREVGELGLTGVDIPERYGGLGLDKATSALVVEALARGGSASWLVTFSCHVGIGTLPIVFYGDEGQKFHSNASARTRNSAAGKVPWKYRPLKKARSRKRIRRSTRLLVRCACG